VQRAVLGFELLEPRQLLSVNVLTFHNDNTRQGLNSSEAMLNPANVNSSEFGKLFTYRVSGQIYAQPLYVSNLAIPGQGIRDVVFAATENNDVYAFDALSNAGSNGGVLWHVNLGLAAAVPNPYFGNRYGPYADITTQIGITSTPVIDLASNTMYLDSFTNDIPGANAYSHHIWALDITTGQQKTAPTLVAASVQGNGAGSVGGVINFRATQQLQRSALTLLNGTLYVAYAGYADTDPYNGWMLGFDPATLQLTKVFNTTPNAGTDSNEGEGGIWAGGYGPSSDGTRLYVMTGNGDFQANIGDYGDSFLELTPDNSTQPTNKNGHGLSVLSSTDYFTPFNEQTLANNDTDLGSGGAMVLPDQPGAHPHLLVGSGKGATLYVIDRENMGGFNSSSDNVVQKVSVSKGVFGGPAYFNSTIYIHPNNDKLKAFSVTNGVVSAAPVAQGATTFIYPGATPSVSSAGTANGIVWEVQYSTLNAVLRAYDAETLGELYNSNQNSARDQMGAGVKFVPPTIAEGRVFVGANGALNVFGLLAPPTQPPATPNGLAASNSTAMQIRLTWTDVATNESAYIIERSTDNLNYEQVALASVNSNSYVDTAVQPETTYFYRIRATNVVGNSLPSEPASATVIPVATPTAIYHFEEGMGLLTVDSAGNNTGMLVGTTKPTWITGRVGNNALSFSGDGVPNSTTSQSAVQTQNSLAGTLGVTATLTAWIKTTQLGNNSPSLAPAITGIEVANSTNDIHWGYLDASGHIGIAAGATGFVSNSVISDGQWHHVALTRSSSTGAVQIYVDGNLQISGVSGAGNKTSVFNLLGAQISVASDGITDIGRTYLNGSLDDVRIFNRVLTADEIATIGRLPDAPTELSTQAQSGSIVKLSWMNPSSFAENIEIQRKVGAGGTYQTIAVLGGTSTNYIDANLAPGTQYFYRARAADLAGASPYSTETIITPPRPEVAGRFAFYNKSSFDGQNGSSNIADNLAVAPDKQALLPGQTATFQNYTSYSNGLNGVIIDVSNLDAPITPSQFTLKVGTSSDVSTWTDAPAPSFVSEYFGWGVGGSTRLELLWDNGQIVNQWLQVTLKADAVTNLAADDVFYFGNAVGETGNVAGNSAIDGGDEIAIRNHFTAPGAAGLTNLYDVNRDKRVDAQDMLLARSHRSGLSPLPLITAPAASVATAVAEQAAAISAPEMDDKKSLIPFPTGSLRAWVASLQLDPMPKLTFADTVDAAFQGLHSSQRLVNAQRTITPKLTNANHQATSSAGSHRDSASINHAATQAANTGFGKLLHTGLRRTRGLFGMMLLLAWASSVRTDAATAYIGSHLLSANTPNQVIPIYVTGGEQIAAVDLFAQIGDGGAFVGGVNVKPSFSNVDILTGTIFARNNYGAFGDLNGVPSSSNAAHPLIWVDGTTTVNGTVTANGLLATLAIDTTGISSGAFPLRITGVAQALGGFNTTLWDADGAPIALTANVGLLTVAPGLTSDFNENGAVDGADFLLWQNGLGVANAAGHGQGDADGDGDVDGADLSIWRDQFGRTSAILAIQAAPEPAGAALAVSALLCASLRRKKVRA
jgi:hypothetical protein